MSTYQTSALSSIAHALADPSADPPARQIPAEPIRNIVDVLIFCQAWELPAEVVGRWVWLEFAEKPSAEIREAIKAAGFRWVRIRGRWANHCGHPCRRGIEDPRYKYGSLRVDDELVDSFRGAV